jgi:xylulokinase
VTGALVGIDVGTSGVKAIAVSPVGDVLATAERGYPLSTPRPGWAEQDPEDWWRATESALAEIRARVPAIAGIGLSGQMHGLVVLDRKGCVLRPAILWNDQRTAVECAAIEQLVGLDRLIALTGNRALAGFTAPKLLWLRAHEPDTFARIDRIMLPKDYVRLRLTGEVATDVADASGTLLFDVAGRCWSDEVCVALDIPLAWLPPAFESPETTGTTTDGIPVAAGAGDQSAAALGVGIDEPGPVSVVLGTSGVVLGVLPGFAADARARVHTFCHASPERWQAMGVMLSAGGSLRWLHDLHQHEPYERLLDEAAAWAPGVEGAIFLPYLAGERTPHADPDARAAFVGLQLRHDRGALTRAVLEGVAFGLRDSLELLRSLGLRPSTARVSGGGARSRLWLEIVASALRLPLEQTASEEGSAFGAALLGGVACGMFATTADAVAACVATRAVIEPDAAAADVYDEVYARYGALYPALETREGR